jgi:leucyl-tRNA synthetase
MQQLGLVDIAEPAARLLTQGMVQSPAYRCAQHGYQPANATSTCTVCSTPLAVAIEKMSKSKYNGVDLPDLMQRYGADAVRLFVLFAAPPEKDLEWTERGVEGVSRFLNRLLNIVQAQKDRFIADLSLHPYPHPDHDIRAATQRCLQRATQEFEQRHHFNTIIAQLMELCNLLYEHQWQNSNTDVDAYVLTETMRIVAQILSPLAPHVAEEIWLHSRGSGLVAQSHWPEINEKLLQNAQVSIIIQVNGKRRGQITVDADIGESELIALAQCDERVQTFLAQKSILRTVVVPQRLVNFVVR